MDRSGQEWTGVHRDTLACDLNLVTQHKLHSDIKQSDRVKGQGQGQGQGQRRLYRVRVRVTAVHRNCVGQGFESKGC